MVLLTLVFFTQNTNEYLIEESDFSSGLVFPFSKIFEFWEIGHIRKIADHEFEGQLVMSVEICGLLTASYFGFVIYENNNKFMLSDGETTLQIDQQIFQFPEIIDEMDKLPSFACETTRIQDGSVTLATFVCPSGQKKLAMHSNPFDEENKPLTDLVIQCYQYLVGQNDKSN